MKVLQIKQVEKRYETFHLKVNFDLHQGETIGFMGPNGAGKTTTISMILNTVRKDEGEILIFGRDHINFEAEVKERMGVILEEQSFYKNLRINYLFKLCASLYPKWDKSKAGYLRNRLELNENKKYQELSKGMKVKFALVVALSGGGEFFLFDEPTSGLDPKVRHTILEEIEIIKEEKKPAILFSSHNMLDVERLADRIILIDKGRIIFDEKKENLLKNWKKILFSSDKPLNIQNSDDIFSIKVEDKVFYKIITNQFCDSLLQRIKKETGINGKVDDLTLEEIFLECTRRDDGSH